MVLTKVLTKLLSKVVDPTNPSSFPKSREIYRNLREAIKGPIWVKHPTNVQIDIHNYCNLWMHGKGCIHCNVKPGGGWNLPRGWMPTEMIEHIIRYWGKHGCKSVAAYVNGEPLLDDRIPWICDISRESGMHVLIDSNVTLYDKRKMMVHPNMKQVRCSFSAITPETYEIVHGADLYREALSTIEWFLKNRKPSQYPMLYFITDKYNQHELLPYIKKWKGRAHLTLFPLHEVDTIQTESEKTKPEDLSYWDKLTLKIVGEIPYQKSRPIDIFVDGKTEVRYFGDSNTCQGTHSFSVAWTGQLLHCTDIPYNFNYGHIYERDMLTVWHERNRAKIGHPACSKCNVKHPQHDDILRKYLKET